MSASNKKKLRKEQEAAKLTEKQLAAQKEAKKANLYTIGFVALMAVILVAAIVIGVRQTMVSSGIREKKTVAMTVDSHKVSNTELNYFYMDAVNQFTNTYGTMASIFGLDLAKPLNEQVQDPETGDTWADYFLETAKLNAKSVYAVADAAKAAGFTLPEADQASITAALNNLSTYAKLYGYSDADRYVKALYGNGASMDSYKSYLEMSSLASSYNTQYAQDLTYTDADIRAKEAEAPDSYSSYSYNSYYLPASRFLEGGTTDEDGNTTYSDEEKAASVTAAKEAAESLIQDVKSVADLDAAIAALPVNADAAVSSTAYVDTLYSKVSGSYAEWVTDSSRKAGDVTVIASTSTTTAEDGTETTVTNGYYAVYFVGSTDNSFPLVNVRHILTAFQGGTKDANTGATTYSDEEKAAAKTAAEEILAQWEAGDKTEASFIALAQEKSDDTGSKDSGGLIENISPDSELVANFLSWSVDPSRKSGDTGIVETEYGYHVMYFVGDAGITYRDYQITNQLRSADLEAWFSGLVDAAEVTDGDTRYIRMNLVINPNA